MIFTTISVAGAYVLDLERRADQRGFFARAWCRNELAALGLRAELAQVSVSFNARRGTLRGMHYQAAPHEEAKVICCTHGAIYDVVLDLREHSPTYLHWQAVELTAENRRMLYVPEGCAHGFQTLADSTELLYMISECYSPEHARGVRYNDPAFNLTWPLPVESIAAADRAWPDYVGLPRAAAPGA